MRVLTFLICDDIRHEVGGKFSLMGVLPGKAQLGNVETNQPFAMRLGLFARVALDTEEVFPDVLKLTVRRGEEVLLSASSPLSGDGEKRNIDIVANLEQRFPSFGQYIFEISLERGDVQIGQPFSQTLQIEGEAQEPLPAT